MNAPVGIGNVEGITVEAPFPSPVTFSPATAERFGLALAALGELGTGSGELFGVDFGAVVFAIKSLSLRINVRLMNAVLRLHAYGVSLRMTPVFGHTKKTKHWLPSLEVSRPSVSAAVMRPGA
ncbi:MAG: hypothetical protein WCC84_07025 [Candidatus Cybelea sp.]